MKRQPRPETSDGQGTRMRPGAPGGRGTRGHGPLPRVRALIASLECADSSGAPLDAAYKGEIEDFATARLWRAYFLSHTAVRAPSAGGSGAHARALPDGPCCGGACRPAYEK